jgi:uncharacterized protein
MRSLGSGGMPSSHTALVAGLTTAVAVQTGVDGPLFAACVVLLMVVAYDATSVRREAGKHAAVLVNIMNRAPELYAADDVLRPGEQLKVTLGHTPIEVAAGGFLGMVVGFIVEAICGQQ